MAATQNKHVSSSELWSGKIRRCMVLNWSGLSIRYFYQILTCCLIFVDTHVLALDGFNGFFNESFKPPSL